ncbi:PspC domain-containing protein [Allohahella marinimesophila]|uniref:Phage shock protein PspC N-terminal domain-containing protein n=1 Tax=Allohahella marinimesophila TaxID=1054972 RepID=A0ABP7NH20_9GAMM
MQLRKSKRRILFGVAGGIAEYRNTSPFKVRMFAMIVLLITGGAVIPVYLVLALVLPPAANSGSSKDTGLA